ncbi:MAG: glycosyltransferase family A protein, partial [Dehalococcoidia bacterium]
VVIPTYNRARVLGRALESVLAQTLPPDEIIVVDDGSDDDTADVVERFEDAQIIYIALAQRRRAAHARNIAIERARGEWIAFLDSDDEWLPGKLEAQMARAGDGVSVIACKTYRKEAGSTWIDPKGDLAEGDALVQLLQGMKTPTTSAYVIRRSALLDVRGFDESFRSSEDYDLLVRLAQAGYRFAAVPEPLMITHAYGRDRMSIDPIGRLHGFRSMNRRWGALMEERAGRKVYRRWARKWRKRLVGLHTGHLAELASSGSRSDALRYALRMLPYLPWGAGYAARALAFAVTGAYRRGRFEERVVDDETWRGPYQSFDTREQD